MVSGFTASIGSVAPPSGTYLVTSGINNYRQYRRSGAVTRCDRVSQGVTAGQFGDRDLLENVQLSDGDHTRKVYAGNIELTER